MTESIALEYVRTLGQRGSLVNEFEYPRGLLGYSNSVVVCDSQNNRLQDIPLGGTPSSIHGDTILSFPYSVTLYDNKFYVSDCANHRIIVYSFSWNYLTTYGTRGDGDGEFDYPSGIAINGDYIYVVDRQNHRVQRLLKVDGTYVDEVGGLLLPEGICIIGDYIYVMDSGNFSLKKYDLDLNFINQKTDFISGYGTDVKNINGVLGVVDTIDSIIIFLNTEFELIRTIHDSLWFPESICYVYGSFIVAQPHELRIYSCTVEFGLQHLDQFIKLNEQLYPTGRVFWKPKMSVFYKMHEALALSESRTYSSAVNLQNSLIADNYNISDIDIAHWEQVYGISSKGSYSEKIALILQRMSYPSNILARQSSSYIQSQLQLAGFNVFVHYAGDLNPNGAIYGGFTYGSALYGAAPLNYTVCANNVQEDRDPLFVMGYELESSFFICGETIGTSTNVPSSRKNEFRELILTLKPAHSKAILLINYTT